MNDQANNASNAVLISCFDCIPRVWNKAVYFAYEINKIMFFMYHMSSFQATMKVCHQYHMVNALLHVMVHFGLWLLPKSTF